MTTPVPTPEALSQHIRALRKARRLSQAELANILGVNQSRIAVIEKRPGAVSLSQFFRILGALNCSLALQENGSVGIETNLAPQSA